jgi:predicted oxidoreductase
VDADVVVVGAGLAGLVAAAELADAGKRVIIVDQEPEQSLGGQAFWSFGGLFLVGSLEQRLRGVRDSRDLALGDWMRFAGFDRDEDHWPRRWAEAYVDFAAEEKRAWLRAQGVRFFSLGWAERAGNSLPRFHVTWGTGPGVLEPFVRRVREAERRGLVTLRFRHRVTRLTESGGTVEGVEGETLAPDASPRGEPTSREVAGHFGLKAQAVIVASGGIGGNHDLVREHWPERMGKPPGRMLRGVPAHVDGLMQCHTASKGARLINADRMWHYPEGVENFDPIWDKHGIRILSGPSPLWLDAVGRRLPLAGGLPPTKGLFPGFSAWDALRAIRETGHDHSWFLLNQRIIVREFALSGSEQNPDLTGKSILDTIRGRFLGPRLANRAPAPIEAFKAEGPDFVVSRDLTRLVRRMNALVGEPLIDATALEREVRARDDEAGDPAPADPQLRAIRDARRRYLLDRLGRVARPHRLLDPDAGPLIAVRLWTVTRKSLGGLQTDLEGRVLRADGEPIPGLYAAGEVAGFGGGGMHGYRALEGTFLGGCLFSGRVVGRSVAAVV